MKAFFVLFLMLASVAHAVEVKVSEMPVDFFRPNAKAAFEINKNNGRAWVEVEMFDQSHGDGGAGSSWTRVKVEGLVFNESLSAITLTHEGQLFECASVTRRWYGTVIRPTGCVLQTRKVRRTYDDGYNTYKRDVFEVTLVTK